jgi:hypothetical protein
MSLKKIITLSFLLVFITANMSAYSEVDIPVPTSSPLPSSVDENNSGDLEIQEIKREESNREESNIDEPKVESPSMPDLSPKLLRGHVSKIPTGTKLKIIIETPINEETSAVNDEIRGKVLKSVYIDKELAIPEGSEVVGNISEISPARKFHRPGKAKVEFKSIKMPDGLQLPISASVLTHKGTIKGNYTKKTGLISAGSILGPIAAGAGAGLLIDSSPIGIGIGAGLGAVAGLGLFLYEKGNKVNIKAGEKLNIELTEDALMPNDNDPHPSYKKDKDLETKSGDTSSKKKESDEVIDFSDSNETNEINDTSDSSEDEDEK